FSSTRAVLVLYGLSSVFLLIAFAVFWSQGRWMPILFGLACLIILLLARSFEFSRKWFAVGRTLESVVELRKESQYALTVARWLEMEAERAASVEALWSDLVFMSEKIGFTRVVLELEDGTREWVSPGDSRIQNRVCRAHELGGGTGVRIEFCGDAGGTNRSYFDHICELFAEAWHNAAARWQTVNGQPVRFAAIAREGRVARVLSPNLATDSNVKGGTPRPS
ncbi:MAG TPA: hypothetical protein PKA41_20285, partial [Verrucomicrobiota bacterium]|nr:hypothetical protein [Verrucomicrobiota bacterium]